MFVLIAAPKLYYEKKQENINVAFGSNLKISVSYDGLPAPQVCNTFTLTYVQCNLVDDIF